MFAIHITFKLDPNFYQWSGCVSHSITKPNPMIIICFTRYLYISITIITVTMKGNNMIDYCIIQYHSVEPFLL